MILIFLHYLYVGQLIVLPTPEDIQTNDASSHENKIKARQKVFLQREVTKKKIREES
jgi:hypothetical protein